MVSLAQALEWLTTHIASPAPRAVSPLQALYCTLAAPTPLHFSPPHPVAALDGHAVHAFATQGASDYAPLPVTTTPVQAGDPLPPGTDAVLPPFHLEHGCATTPVAPGQNVIPPGHDSGPNPLPIGTRLHPLHISLLVSHPIIHPIPYVSLEHPTPLLAALFHGMEFPPLQGAPNLILTGARPPSNAPIQSIAIHPGEPTALGHLDGPTSRPTPAVFLPRLPEDCAAAFDLLILPTIRHLAHLPRPRTIPATLSRKITSPIGITSAIRVSLQDNIATPLPPGIAAATADALVLVPEGSEGYPEGATIQAHPLR